MNFWTDLGRAAAIAASFALLTPGTAKAAPAPKGAEQELSLEEPAVLTDPGQAHSPGPQGSEAFRSERLPNDFEGGPIQTAPLEGGETAETPGGKIKRLLRWLGSEPELAGFAQQLLWRPEPDEQADRDLIARLDEIFARTGPPAWKHALSFQLKQIWRLLDSNMNSGREQTIRDLDEKIEECLRMAYSNAGRETPKITLGDIALDRAARCGAAAESLAVLNPMISEGARNAVCSDTFTSCSEVGDFFSNGACARLNEQCGGALACD